MMPTRMLGAVVWAALSAVLVAQTPSAPARAFEVFEIRYPDAESYLAGPVVLRAVVEPPGAAAKLTFFVDGREVCVVDGPPFECDWDAGQNVVERQIRVLANFADGSRLARTVRTQGLGITEKVDVDVVQVTVTVTNDRGEFVAGLPQSAFHVFEDGKPQTITYFASEDVPLELVVAVDISGSMATAMPKLKRPPRRFSGPCPRRIGCRCGASTTPCSRSRAGRPILRKSGCGPSIAWRPGAQPPSTMPSCAASRRSGRAAGRKALVVFSDGEDQGSHVTLDQVEQRLQASDVTLYMIGQGRGLSVDRLQKSHGTAVDADRRPRVRDVEHRRVAAARSTRSSRSFRINI